jgi:hypothetical protein
VDSKGRTVWIVGAHRGDGKRFMVRADEKLTAFPELESAIRACRNLFRRPDLVVQHSTAVDSCDRRVPLVFVVRKRD